MGSYCELYISDFSIASTKNEIDPFLLSIFQTEDIRTFDRKIEERHQLLHGIEDEAEEVENAIQYTNSAKNIRDRLNVMGFTLEKSKENFKESKAESLLQLKEWFDDSSFNSSERMNESLTSQIKVLENSSFDDFLKASKEIIDNKYGYNTKIEELPKDINPIILYLLDHGYGLDKFPHNYDQRTLLRALLEITPPDTPITYDITELVKGGYYEQEPDSIYDEVIGNWSYDYELGDKFLILAEGTSDINTVKKSLDLLYPHLSGYYSFMDFGISNASGSASSLVASVKSFVGADIKNKIIALFDNDTAAASAIKGLSKTKIPGNIKIKKYPELDIAKDYPTIGPTGITNMDVNGLAGSLELYFGKDVLTENKNLIPIQWKGYDSSLKKYQGEIINKTMVQKKFDKKLKECIADREKIDNYDWSGMDSLLQMIFETFNE